jgi:hypothetical protein
MMKSSLQKNRLLFSAAVLCLFTFALAQTADAGDVNLQKWLRANNATAKLVKLDRGDGFSFGFSLKSPRIPSIIIAPGLKRMLLLQVDGEELILQPDQAGQMQVISATEGVWTWICYLQKILAMLTSTQSCTTPLCYANALVNLLIGLNSCVPAA